MTPSRCESGAKNGKINGNRGKREPEARRDREDKRRRRCRCNRISSRFASTAFVCAVSVDAAVIRATK